MKTIKFLVVAVLAITITSCGKQGVTNKSLETEIDSVSYAIGLDMSTQIKKNFPEINIDLYTQGYRNGMDSTNLLINNKDTRGILAKFFQKRNTEIAKKRDSERAKEFEAVKKAGEEFLAKNKSKKGVVTTASGLQYLVLKEGKGAKMPTSGKVKLHYHGTLIDGTVFDSSVDKKKPITHSVTGFVKGFNEGLQFMKKGSKHRFFIPQELGYGANPRGGKIKPFATIIFDVEILEIVK